MNNYRPDYVENRSPWPILPGPFQLQQMQASQYFIASDQQQLQKLCDHYLNDPTQGEAPYTYKVVFPYSMLVWLVQGIRSTDPAAVDAGWMPESELDTWVLTVAVDADGKPDHLAWFIPYLFVDVPTYMATGREVYGFNKRVGHFQNPLTLTNPEFTLSTQCFSELTADSQGTTQHLMSVQQTQQSAESATAWSNAVEHKEGILQLLFDACEGAIDAAIIELFDEGVDFVAQLVKLEMRLVFLKQFRDAEHMHKACYQAIIEAPVQLTAFYGAGVVSHQYQLLLNQVPDIPIAEDLGWQVSDGKVAITATTWAHIDLLLEKGFTVWEAQAKPEKIAVLGSGMGSLATLFALTSTPGWQQKYDFTVYQLGWRSGGKGASGRQQDAGDRIEEHGLHIFFGFYNNAFRVMRACYDELNRPSNAPLATWEEAFTRHNLISIMEFHNEQWKPWLFPFPSNDNLPGTVNEGSEFTPLTAVRCMVEKALESFLGLDEVKNQKLESTILPDFLDKIIEAGEQAVEQIGFELASHLFTGLHKLLQTLEDDVSRWEKHHHSGLKVLFKTLLKTVESLEPDDLEDDIRRLWMLIRFALWNAYGMLLDGVLLGGYEVINDRDYRQWLSDLGAGDDLIYSAPVRSQYDLFFAYQKGEYGPDDPTQAGNLSAGTLLHFALLSVFGYSGSPMWKMNAGMGDVIFTPLYEVLLRRGVKFKYFQKIVAIEPGETDQGLIEKIILNEQVTLKPGIDHYNPLILVKGLPCWPSEPLYDQIEQGAALKAENIDLESYWTAWQDVNKGIELQLGRDFDRVICGINIASLVPITPKLSAANPAWATMLEKVETVQTQALQLWLKADLKALGWELGSVVLDAYVEPFNTWAVMDQTLPAEDWPTGYDPLNIAYFCGTLPDAAIIPPASDHDFPEQQYQRVHSNAVTWLTNNIEVLWPNIDTIDKLWNALIDINDGTGLERLDAQYWKANIDPGQRYTLSVADTDQYRLRPGDSGFKNMTLTGDWIYNDFINVGAIEPTTVAALQAAEAFSGEPQDILPDRLFGL